MNEKTFEQALSRLDEIAELLDSGEQTLDDSLKLLEEGTELVNFCTQKLSHVEERIKILRKDDQGFSVQDEDLT